MSRKQTIFYNTTPLKNYLFKQQNISYLFSGFYLLLFDYRLVYGTTGGMAVQDVHKRNNCTYRYNVDVLYTQERCTFPFRCACVLC